MFCKCFILDHARSKSYFHTAGCEFGNSTTDPSAWNTSEPHAFGDLLPEPQPNSGPRFFSSWRARLVAKTPAMTFRSSSVAEKQCRVVRINSRRIWMPLYANTQRTRWDTLVITCVSCTETHRLLSSSSSWSSSSSSSSSSSFITQEAAHKMKEKAKYTQYIKQYEE